MDNSVADLAIRLKNGYMSGKKSIIVRYSSLNRRIVEILKKEQYIASFEISSGTKKNITLQLLYQESQPAVKEVQVISKSGRRVYGKVKHIKPVVGGFGLEIMTTPKGVMTAQEAKKRHVGGEILFRIW